MKRALKIYKKLIADGKINDIENRDMFSDYFIPEVHKTLEDIASELDFDIVELPHDIYLVPKLSNSIINFSMKDIRTGISSSARLADAYLQCYIIMLILYLFFGGKNTNPKNTEFLQIKDIVSEADARFLTADITEEDEYEEKYSVNFKAIKEIWINKPVFDDGKRSTRSEFVLKACRFLESQKLLKILDNNSEIRTTQRLDDLMINYYLSEDRVNEINEMFNSGGIKNAKNQQN